MMGTALRLAAMLLVGLSSTAVYIATTPPPQADHPSPFVAPPVESSPAGLTPQETLQPSSVTPGPRSTPTGRVAPSSTPLVVLPSLTVPPMPTVAPDPTIRPTPTSTPCLLPVVCLPLPTPVVCTLTDPLPLPTCEAP